MIKRYLGTVAARLIREATSHHERQLREIAAFSVLQFNLQKVGFDTLLFPGGYAANATLLLEIFRVLETLRPNAVLECGSGESTGILAYHARRHPDCSVVSLEDQPAWSAKIEHRFLAGGKPANFELVTAPLDTVADEDDNRRKWYKGEAVDRALSDRRFNLILVDGPSGRSGAGRAGLLSRFPHLIDEQFVLFFDDASSSIYKSDIAAIAAALKKYGRAFVTKTLTGEKEVAVFASPDLKDVVGGQLS